MYLPDKFIKSDKILMENIKLFQNGEVINEKYYTVKCNGNT